MSFASLRAGIKTSIFTSRECCATFVKRPRPRASPTRLNSVFGLTTK
jgi:hypothetical protein